MTGMEHAIEQAAKVIWEAPTADFGGVSERDAHFLARALAEAGLLAPAPLTEVQAEAWDEAVASAHLHETEHFTSIKHDPNPYRQEADR